MQALLDFFADKEAKDYVSYCQRLGAAIVWMATGLWSHTMGIVCLRLFRMILSLAPCAQDGKTCLSWASSNGHLDVVEALLDAGADKHAKDEVGGWQGSWKAGMGEGSLVFRMKQTTVFTFSSAPQVCAVRQHRPHARQRQGPHFGGADAQG